MFVRTLSFTIFFSMPGLADADNSPPEWLGRSILLRYNEVRTFEPVKIGNGRTHADTVNQQAVIYISDRGRIFAQAQRNIIAEGRYSRSFNMVKSPDSTTQGSDWRFEGENLYGFTKLGEEQGGSVRRVAVRFSRDSQTCMMTIGYARARGAETIIVQGWHGEYYYLRHHELTSSSCELKAGNVFDNAN
jgi:hypothetical protein